MLLLPFFAIGAAAQSSIDLSVIRASDAIAFAIHKNATDIVRTMPPSKRQESASYIVALDSEFRRVAPGIIQSNMDTYKIASQSKGSNFVNNHFLALKSAKKAVKELQDHVIAFTEGSTRMEKRSPADPGMDVNPMTEAEAKKSAKLIERKLNKANAKLMVLEQEYDNLANQVMESEISERRLEKVKSGMVAKSAEISALDAHIKSLKGRLTRAMARVEESFVEVCARHAGCAQESHAAESSAARAAASSSKAGEPVTAAATTAKSRAFLKNWIAIPALALLGTLGIATLLAIYTAHGSMNSTQSS